MSSRKEPRFEELLPIELKLRLLQAELDRLESDIRWIEQRKLEVVDEVAYYRELLNSRRREVLLKLVK